MPGATCVDKGLHPRPITEAEPRNGEKLSSDIISDPESSHV